MVVQVVDFPEVTALLLSGNLDAAAGTDLDLAAADLLQGYRSQLVVDLSGVQQVYSSGVAILIKFQAKAAAVGTRVTFCGLRPFVREFLNISNADQDLECLPDLETAMELLSIS